MLIFYNLGQLTDLNFLKRFLIQMAMVIIGTKFDYFSAKLMKLI